MTWGRSLLSLRSGGEDAAVDLAPRLAPHGPHDALVQPGVLFPRLLDQQRGHVVLHADRDTARLLDGPTVVGELQVWFVTAREADVKSDVVALVDGHLLHGVHGARRGLGDVLSAGLHHIKVAASFGCSGDVFEKTGEDPGVVGAGLDDGERGGGVGGDDVEVGAVLDRECVAVPLDLGRRCSLILDGEGGGLALADGEGLEADGQAGTR